jgi:hypothetical protein
LEEHATSIFNVEVHGHAARKVVTQFNRRWSLSGPITKMAWNHPVLESQIAFYHRTKLLLREKMGHFQNPGYGK